MKILIMPNSLDNIEVFKDCSGYVVGIDGLSWYIPLKASKDNLNDLISKVKKQGKEIFVSLNKLMYNQDIPLLKEYLLIIEKLDVDGIMYDDLAVFNLAKSLSLKTPLVWAQTHLFTNFYTSNYWYTKGVKYGLLSPEITLDDIKVINNNSNMSLMMYGYGYLPMFVSSRSLLSSYSEYVDISKNDEMHYMYEEQRKKAYPTYEDKNDTVILSSDIINTIDELPALNDNVDYLILSSLNISDEKFSDIYHCYMEAFYNLDNKDLLKNLSHKVDENSPTKTDKGFLYKETIYRVKNDE